MSFNSYFFLFFFFFNDTATTEIYTVPYTLSLHDALPICLLHEELPLHDREAPVALAADHLACLEAVAEHPQRLPHRQPIGGGDVGQPVEAGRRGTGEDRLAEPYDELLRQALLVHREEQHAHARAPVGRLLLGEPALDPRLALASDHR